MSEGDPDPDAGDDEDAPDSDGADGPPDAPDGEGENPDADTPEETPEDDSPEEAPDDDTSEEETSATDGSDEDASDSEDAEAPGSENHESDDEPAADDDAPDGRDPWDGTPADDDALDDRTPWEETPQDDEAPGGETPQDETPGTDERDEPSDTHDETPGDGDKSSDTYDETPGDGDKSSDAYDETPDGDDEQSDTWVPEGEDEELDVGMSGTGPAAGESVDDSFDSGYIAEGAPDDQEMPLTEHIEEMVRRLAVVIVVMALVSAVVLPLADRFVNFLWYSFLPGPPTECVQSAAALPTNMTGLNESVANATGVNVTAGNATGMNVTNVSSALGSSGEAACPRLYHPLALVFARLKMASLAGFVFALPVFVYETYLFMRPGLYPNERRYYLASVPTSLILAGIGLAFAYFLVLPVIFIYFLGYSQPVAEVAFGLTKTFNLILLMMGMFALIFQIPLFVMLAIMMGVTSREWLQDRRLYFWFGFGGVAFIFSPDPTGMAPFIVAATMILLFEGTLLLLRWTGR